MMTTTLRLDHGSPASAVGNTPIYGAVRGLINILKVWVDRANKRHELRILLFEEDRIMQDINIQRLDVAQEAFKPFWRA